MNLFDQSRSEDVEHLMTNAQLRDELEPLYDESIGRVNSRVMTTRSENEFLASMLEWERAPILPIYRWFEPELSIPAPDSVPEDQVGPLLHQTIGRLFDQHIVLDFTDHLSDFELYCLIYRDILPAQEKKLDRKDTYLHWDCANVDGDPEVWLRFYASEEDRRLWEQEHGDPAPPHEDPPHSRRLPRVPL